MNFGRVLASSLLCLVILARLEAQTYSHISGVILDASLASVPGALVTVVNEDSGLRRVASSQADGGYAVSSLQPGIYKITVRKPGFRTMIRFGVALTESKPARVDFKLVIGSVQETITVEGSAPLFNTEEASVGTVVGRDEVEHLPLDGQGLLGLIGLVPGAVVTPATRGEAGQFTVDGQRPNTHYFTVDGASANTGVSGGGSPAQANGGALAGHDRLRQPGQPAHSGCAARDARPNLHVHAAVRKDAGRAGFAHQPFRIERVSRIGALRFPKRSARRE